MQEVNYKKYLWPVGFLLLCIFIGFLSYRIFVFQIISTSPANGGETNSSTGTLITITYNKELAANNKNIIITASDDIITGFRTDHDKLLVQTHNLSFDKSYEIYIKNILSTDNSKMDSYTFRFTNKYKSFSDLSRDDQKKQIEQTDKNTHDDPVTRALPVTTSAYYISFEMHDTPDEKGKYEKIIIALLVTNAQQDNLKLVKDYKTQAINFLISKGIDPDDYIVEWSPEIAQNL